MYHKIHAVLVISLLVFLTIFLTPIVLGGAIGVLATDRLERRGIISEGTASIIVWISVMLTAFVWYGLTGLRPSPL